jgi:hypothetical protein
LKNPIVAAVILLLMAQPSFSQDIQGVPGHFEVNRYWCPGDPFGNLASFDCSFTKTMRAEQFVTSTVTDQAILGAGFTGLFAHLRNDPPEWQKNWDGLGRRVASRYERKILGGGVEYVVGLAMKTDPRHVHYDSDPRISDKNRQGGAWARAGHALGDWATVPRSAVDARGRRLPNLPLLAGALANGFAGRYWYPDRQRTTSQSLRRALGPLETSLVGSYYAEFGPEIGRALGSIFKRRPKAPPVPQPGGGN